jgi:RNA polymerase sigma factor (sigma-70 family)
MRPSDAQLLQEYARQGSQSAFRELVKRHTKLVYSICYRKLHDEHLAEDATQQVFLDLASQAGRTLPGPVDGFLANIAYRVTIDMWRSCSTRKKHEREFMKTRATVQKQVSADPRLSKLHEALDRLGSNFREPVTLRYIEGMSIPSICVALNLSDATVRKRLLRALDRMRKLMGDQGMSLAVAAGMLGRVIGPLPRQDLAERIANRVLSAKPPAPALPLRPRLGYAPRLAAGLGAASVVVAVVAVQLVPRATPSPAAGPAPWVSGAITPHAAPPSDVPFGQKLGRRIPDFVARDIPLEFALQTLQDASGVQLRPQWDAIEAAGVDRNTHVVTTITNSNVFGHLDALLKAASADQLEYQVSEEQRVIIIRPRGARPDSRSGISAAH